MNRPLLAVIMAVMLVEAKAGPFLCPFALAAPPKRPQILSTAIQKQFRRAVEAFDNKSYEEAVDQLSKILQRQPDFVPAKIQLARSLYELKRSGEAYRLFQQIDLALLEPEAAYAYGQTAFQAEDSKAALAGFSQVPNGHALYDLAGYYGGIAAFKLGAYEDSIRLLGQAVVLPSKLVRSQKLYQREAERLLLQKQKQEVRNNANFSTTVTTPNPALPPAVAVDLSRDNTYRFLRPVRVLAAIPQYTLQSLQPAGKKEPSRDIKIKSGELQFAFGASRAASDHSPHILLQARASLSALEGTEGKQRIGLDPREEEELAVIAKEPPTSIFYMDLLAGIEWPLTLNSTFGINLGTYAHSNRFYPDQTYYSPWLGLFVAQKNAALESQAKVEVHARFLDARNQLVNSRQLGRLSLSLPANFFVAAEGEFSQYNFAEERIEGADWRARALLELGYQKNQVFWLYAGPLYEKGSGWHVFNFPDSKDTRFDETILGAQVRSELELFTWLRLGLLARTLDKEYQDFKTTPLNSAAALQRGYLSSVSHFSIYTVVKTSF